jgi:predicted DsbA family dithiol-disulfide isomerase
LQREYDVELEYVHFPLHPDTPADGMLLVDMFGGPQAMPRIRESQKRLKALAEAEGLPMSDRERTYNSRLAQELGVWAEEQGKGEAFHERVFKAYFVDGKNIGSAEVLVEIAREAGLDPALARKVIETRSHSARVDADWRRSHEAGVTGVPTFVAGGERVVGAQPYEVLVDLVVKAGARKLP